MHSEPAFSEAARHLGERVHVDNARADLGEFALGLVRVGEVELFGHREPEDGIAEELETFVGGQSAVLVGVRAVGERQGQEFCVQRHAEGGEERLVALFAPSVAVSEDLLVT